MTTENLTVTKNPVIYTGKVPKLLLIVSVIFTLLYFSWWFNPSHVGNPIFYGLLFFGEVYHVGMAFLFIFTVWPHKKEQPEFSSDNISFPSVDVFITVAGEPVDVVRKTVLAAKRIRYSNFRIHILNDSYVAKKHTWKDIEVLANQLGVDCITRKIPGGAKAGNINNALRQTSGDLIAIFDADMVAYPNFLEKLVPYFHYKNTGFVQSPQYYRNAEKNEITGGAWEQQEFFFGPVMKGKDNTNSAFICGTNVVIRREALLEVGGMDEKNIAEDFLTSLFIHQKGWKSYYVTDVLAEGLAPEDLLSYYKQQLRWARGNIEVFFSFNPLFKKISLKQKLQYLSSSLYYFNGVIVLIDIIMPLIALFTGITPVSATTTSFALFFIPFIFLNLYLLYLISDKRITFRAISFSQASFILQLEAIFSVLRKQKIAFAVTPKQMQEGNYLSLAYPHIAYCILVVLAIGVAIVREGLTPSVAANLSWALFNIILFYPFIKASYKWKQIFSKQYSHTS